MKEQSTQAATSSAVALTLPRFITFTGVDEATSLDDLRVISAHYPVEWGVLFSPRHQGTDNRYPSIRFVQQLTGIKGIRLAAHLCGGYARELISEGKTSLDLAIKSHFARVQINTADPNIDLQAISAWARSLEVEVIVQCRDGFPSDGSVSWLYDVSGGRGLTPALWPPAHPDVLCGYAGGIGPHNILQVLDRIGAISNAYWLDMESHVRSQGDLFDLRKCLAVCEAVYGVRDGAMPRNMLPTGLTTGDLLAMAGSLEAGTRGMSLHDEDLHRADSYLRSHAAALIRVVATRGLLTGLAQSSTSEQAS